MLRTFANWLSGYVCSFDLHYFKDLPSLKEYLITNYHLPQNATRILCKSKNSINETCVLNFDDVYKIFFEITEILSFRREFSSVWEKFPIDNNYQQKHPNVNVYNIHTPNAMYVAMPNIGSYQDKIQSNHSKTLSQKPSKTTQNNSLNQPIHFDSHTFSSVSELISHYRASVPFKYVKIRVCSGKDILYLHDTFKKPIDKLIISEGHTLKMLSNLKKYEIVHYLKQIPGKVIILTEKSCFEMFEQNVFPLSALSDEDEKKFEYYLMKKKKKQSKEKNQNNQKKSKSQQRQQAIHFDSHKFSSINELKNHYVSLVPFNDVQIKVYTGKKIIELDFYKCDEPIKILIIQETSTLSMLNHIKKEEFINLFIKNTTDKVVIITQEMCFDKFEQRLLPLKNMPKAIKEKYENNEFSLKTPDVAMIGPLVNEFMSLLSKDDLMMDTFNEFINQPGIDKGLKKRYLSLTDPENQLNEIRNRYLNASSKGVFVVASSFILLHTAVKTLKENNIKIGHIKIGHVTEELISNLLLENEVEPSLILINVNIADAFLMGEKFINVYHGVEEYLDLIKGRATINRS